MNKFNVNFRKIIVPFLILIIMVIGHTVASAQQKEMIVRISEIEINSADLEQYKAILKEESEASVRLEPGVICIFPMFEKENPAQIRLLEIYASKEAYDSHIKSVHFQKYKTTTLKMVKSLKLIDQTAIDPETMSNVFRKMKKSKKDK